MAIFSCSFTRLVVSLSVILLGYWCVNMYNLYVTASCTVSSRCLKPAYTMKRKMQLLGYTSTRREVDKGDLLTGRGLIVNETNFLRNETWNINVNISLPNSTLRNGSLYFHLFLGPASSSSLLKRHSTNHIASLTVPLTRYKLPSGTEFNLLNGNYLQSLNDNSTCTHWIPQLSLYGVGEDWSFDTKVIPPELWITDTLKLIPNTMTYVPLLFCNELSVLNKDLLQVTPSNKTMSLSLSYTPIGLGLLRIWIQFTLALKTMGQLGFPEKEMDTVKELVFGTNFYLLGLTFIISFFHMLFDFLAFKNDINFWRKRKNTIGLSRRTVLWRCFSYTVVLLYLLEENTSLLVTVPSGIGAIIEYWKAFKAMKVSFTWSNGPKIKFIEQLKEEKETESYDSQAMKYLSYFLTPLVILGAIYCLLYHSYKSWYSWLIHSLVNGIYMFGFLFMLPQLFVNYKLKSVAHLPWRAFMYKAFNTFIDDVFAFIITMPTSHRLAVFRDDLVFLVYLYQRWLYPVDRNRVNEFGQTFTKDKTKKD